ncbi:glutamate 5-kinase [Marinilabiliaceae bacterium ANBcel2]|nr:glutamate 5-kinase [Marinilabiliaceae bacterium ANBcel2]
MTKKGSNSNKCITIKIGSNVLTRNDGMLDTDRISHITDQIAFLHNKGYKIVLVSSGAVASGRTMIKFPFKLDPVSERQLLSAVGQVKLLTTYSKMFERHNLTSSQVLVTKEDFRTRRHYLNMKNCISVLLNNNIIPIVNENDAVSVTALMFTDNDELAGLTASMMDSDQLFILSNVDGIYTGDPNNKESQLIEEVDHSTHNLKKWIVTQKSNFGRGGMVTKSRIAKKTAAAGITVRIANGTAKNIITSLTLEPEKTKHTRFIPAAPSRSIKKWIAYSEEFTQFEVTINEGANEALHSKKANSLLLAGITNINGNFKKGDLIKIKNHNNELIGIGKTQYDKETAESHINDKKYKPLVHYDYLFLYP